MDGEEFLYCRTTHYGQCVLADNPRFFILKKISEDGKSICLGETIYPLSLKE